MPRSQIIALLLGAGVVIVGVVAAWRGVLPGFAPSAPQAVATKGSTPLPTVSVHAPASSPSAASQSAAASPPPATSGSAAASSSPAAKTQADLSPKPEQEAALPPNAEPGLSVTPIAPGPVPLQPQSTPDVLVFDTVRVEPSGEMVVAGHGAPDARIALTANDKVIAEVDADGAGNFVILPPPLAPGNYVLALRSSGKDGSLESRQNVAVSVPTQRQKNVVAALAEPGKPTVVLSDTAKAAGTPPASTQPGQPTVAFRTAEVDKGGFYASGSATPGAHLRIYLNGTALSDVTAAADGHWSLTIGKGMGPGHFAVRADVIDENGKVIARAEVPFDVPVSVAEADAPQAESAAGTAPLPPMVPPAVPPPMQPAPRQVTAAPPPPMVPTVVPPSTPPAPRQVTAAPPADEPAPAAQQARSESQSKSTPNQGAAPRQGSSASQATPPAATAPGDSKAKTAITQSVEASHGAASDAAAPPSAEAAKQSATTESNKQEAASSPPLSSTNDAYVPSIETTAVVRGDSLWRISRKIFGHGIRYTLIYEANADQIRDPSLIYPGQIFVVPR